MSPIFASIILIFAAFMFT
ncbi:hypothetical protein EOL73_01025 [Candidatus Saccharibacteria bacterium]|nr:hypothetical protein [Candidatus Saccharibacteria bacterium]NCU40327.1 hypothetical protein [Candidatus Saccharibacteria bacterium]